MHTSSHLLVADSLMERAPRAGAHGACTSAGGPVPGPLPARTGGPAVYGEQTGGLVDRRWYRRDSGCTKAGATGSRTSPAGRWAWPVATDGTGWAIALDHRLITASRHW